MLNEIDLVRQRLGAAVGVADVMGAGWESFELARSASRRCGSRDRELPAAFTLAAAAATKGRNTLKGAPSLQEVQPPAECAAPADADVARIAGGLAELAGDALGQAAAGPGIGEHPSRTPLVASFTEGRRVMPAMLRLIDDIGGGPEADRSPVPGVWSQAAARAQSALGQAAQNLLEGIDHFGGTEEPGSEDMLARQLGQAARSVFAGRDLPQTHFAAGAGGATVPSSSWSAAISSPQAARVLLTEIGGWCRQLSPVLAELSTLRSRRCPMPHRVREKPAASYHGLLAADMAIWAAAQDLSPLTINGCCRRFRRTARRNARHPAPVRASRNCATASRSARNGCGPRRGGSPGRRPGRRWSRPTPGSGTRPPPRSPATRAASSSGRPPKAPGSWTPARGSRSRSMPLPSLRATRTGTGSPPPEPGTT